MDDRRVAQRCTDVPVTIHQCVVTHLGKETWLDASAVDLSHHGLCLILGDSLNAGESLYLLATVHPADRAPRDLAVNGVTSYCRPAEGNRWRVGVQFLDLSDEEQVEWENFLNC